jgi:NAD-dependent deacetylase
MRSASNAVSLDSFRNGDSEVASDTREKSASAFIIPAQLIERLRRARHVAILTGAGTSAESGVPTFRDAQTGLWSKYSPEELATPEAFKRNPRLVWEWYAWRRQRVDQVKPNAGHLALARLESLVPRVTLITQNVDGLHQEAGSTRVLELHGNIRRTKCFPENIVIESWAATDQIPPLCPRCSGLLRPDVVWFGESLDPEVLNEAEAAARTCDVFLSIGTSSVVFPAAALPHAALAAEATVVEINPTPTSLAPDAAYSFAARSGEFLPVLMAATWGDSK